MIAALVRASFSLFCSFLPQLPLAHPVYQVATNLKVKEIQEVYAPQNAAEMRSLLGLTNYVSRFITDYATITEPLRQLTRQDTPFNWTSECQNALNELKARLTSETVMSYYDPTKPTELKKVRAAQATKRFTS